MGHNPQRERRMKRHIAIYAGTMALLFATNGPVFSADRTDMTEGKGIPKEYSDTPVRQGKLIEVKDSKYKNSDVFNVQGENVGKINEVLKDKVTNEIEYVIFTSAESNRDMPMRWSQFQMKDDKLQLKLNKEEFQNVVRMNSSKDQSPDIKEYMDEINQVRSGSVPNQNANPGLPGQRGPDATGSMGEDSVGGGGRSGTSGLPPGQAPGFEGGHPSSKR